MSASQDRQVVATNRQVRRSYEILDTLECGMVLRGSEVKSLRSAKVTLADAYARVDRNELWLHSLHVSPYSHSAAHSGHDPERPRKLLAHRNQIDRWAHRLSQERLTLVPLSLFFVNGRAKIEIGLARGLRQGDRRADIAPRDADREAQMAMSDNRRGRGAR